MTSAGVRQRRIVAFATNPATAASTRFRVVQWMPFLADAGFTLTLDAFFSARAAELLYRRRQHLLKLGYLAVATARRLAAFLRASRDADMLFIHREAFPLGRRILFDRLRRFAGPIVYDYDDAMFLPQRQSRGLLSRLEDLETPKAIMQFSAAVFAGNRYLADFAAMHAQDVRMLPTSLDTDVFAPGEGSGRERGARLGWIGSHSTAKYLQSLWPVLEQVGSEHTVDMLVVGAARQFTARRFAVVQRPWALEREAADFASCDIGLYPLWDDPWTRGKCGFKAIQFMACGVPVVAAAVGANRDIIEDGVNGFLAATDEEWREKLGVLIRDPALRVKLGQAGRQTVEERYSVRANAPLVVKAIRDAAR